MNFRKEIERRRTFGIISHPDAGKTTLTEKLLLFGGAIQVAGAVKSNKIKKSATSDFMEIERQRGISVATSVMGFEYEGYKVNILDTPGHQDFAEDTYRTLTAVDSVIIVIDAAKGVEAQTRKLMEVCRMRKTPVIVFINKMDRPALDPFDLLDEVENELEIEVCPLSWPIGSGRSFKGLYNIFEQKLNLFTSGDSHRSPENIEIAGILSGQADKYFPQQAQTLKEELELASAGYPAFDHGRYLDAGLAPVFFGSALNNFGVRELLGCFLDIAPYPGSTEAKERTVSSGERSFTGFVFKIHANMDPNHRDRLAFLKISSGVFERNKSYLHSRSGRNMKFSNPTAFMAEKKSVVDKAFPGDIVGLHDTGTFKIGDTLTEGEMINFKGIPSFSPEFFRYVENSDPLKSKQLAKGLNHLMDEGVAQMFVNQANGRKIIGTVGPLQFDVIQFRLLHEYGASCRFEPLQLYKACWMECPDKTQLEDFKMRKLHNMAHDKWGRDVFLAESPHSLDMARERFPGIKFHLISDFAD